MVLNVVHKEDWKTLLHNASPRGLRSGRPEIASLHEIEAMMRNALTVEETFFPSAWSFNYGTEIAGLCLLAQSPREGVAEISYGVAKSLRNLGLATRAIGALRLWAAQDKRIVALIATTDVENEASHRVLQRNAFREVTTPAESLTYKRVFLSWPS